MPLAMSTKQQLIFTQRNGAQDDLLAMHIFVLTNKVLNMVSEDVIENNNIHSITHLRDEA